MLWDSWGVNEFWRQSAKLLPSPGDLSSCFLTFAHQIEAIFGGWLRGGIPTPGLINFQHSAESQLGFAPTQINLPAGDMHPLMLSWMYNWELISFHLKMICTCQENVSCLNTTLVFLMFANQKSALPKYLEALSKHKPSASECTNANANIMKNFRYLLPDYTWLCMVTRRSVEQVASRALESRACLAFSSSHWLYWCVILGLLSLPHIACTDVWYWDCFLFLTLVVLMCDAGIAFSSSHWLYWCVILGLLSLPHIGCTDVWYWDCFLFLTLVVLMCDTGIAFSSSHWLYWCVILGLLSLPHIACTDVWYWDCFLFLTLLVLMCDTGIAFSSSHCLYWCVILGLLSLPHIACTDVWYWDLYCIPPQFTSKTNFQLFGCLYHISPHIQYETKKKFSMLKYPVFFKMIQQYFLFLAATKQLYKW